MKFREKTYIVTLLLFLIFLNAGIFSLAYYTYKSNADSAEAVCMSEEKVIAEAFEKDMQYLGAVNESNLFETYGVFYKKKDIFLSFSSDGQTLFSTIPKGITPPKNGYSSTQRTEDKRFFLVTESIYNGKYIFTYAKDVSYLDEEFKSISVVFVMTSFGASILLAVILFFVLRKLSLPLEKLRAAANEISNGNFGTRADESGKDEIALLAADFNRMAEHIGEQMRELETSASIKQQMLDNLAHEMNTPLTSIRGYAEYLLNANIEEAEKTEAAEYIISEAERLKNIGERLLDDAFIRENGIRPEKTNLSHIIASSAKALSVKAANAGVTLKTDTVNICLECDPLLITLLLTNLANNATKACKDGGCVTLGCGYDTNGNAFLYVSDTGIGMTDEQIAHITEPFYRTDKSRSRSEGGTGLGLSLCARIAKAHNAVLSFESAVSKGTTATLTFTTS